MSKVTDSVRLDYVNFLTEVFANNGEDVQRIKSNKIAFPCAKDEEEFYVEITVSIPKGTKDEPYDAYERAESYRIECETKAEKERKRAEEKARKMKRDAERREKEGE